MMRQAVPLQPMEDPTPEQEDTRRRLLSHGKCTLEQAPGRTCGPVERGAHAGAGLMAGLVMPTLEHSVPEGLHPMEVTCAGAVHGELWPLRRAHVGQVMEDCLPWEGPHTDI